jgi:beta-mannosidase
VRLGREFYFKINGIQIYSKGSNSIPFHILPERVTPEHLKWVMQSAKDVHTNMIRVWGGGMYEPDLFYEVRFY